MSKRFYEYEIRTPQNKIENAEGWYSSKMPEAIAEIEQKLKKSCRLRSIERHDSKGKKE